MHPFWLVAVAIISAPFIGRAYVRRHRQVRGLTDLARRCNLRFSAIDLIGLHERYYNLQLMRRGHSRHAWNVLYGTTEAGLIAIFRYSYDSGFGVHQSAQQWWIGVLEGTDPFANWQAAPCQATADSGTARVGPFSCQADQADTLAKLAEPGPAAALLSLPDTWHLEASGVLLAMAAPGEDDASVAGQLYHSLQALAQELRQAGL